MRFRVPQRATAGRPRVALPGTSPAPEPTPRAADLLFRSRAGRLFIGSAILKLFVALIRRVFADLPTLVELLSGAATLGLIASLCYFLWRLFVLAKRRLLWRVRRKLILSYIFIGAVPALLIASFFLLSANFASMNVSAYLFKDAYDGVVGDVRLTAVSVAEQLVQQPTMREEVLKRAHKTLSQRYPGLVLALAPPRGGEPLAVGNWEHQRPPLVMPSWLTPEGFSGTAAVLGDDADELQLVVRAVRPVVAPAPHGNLGWIVVDLPVDDFLLGALRETTGVKANAPKFSASESAKGTTLFQTSSDPAATAASSFIVVRQASDVGQLYGSVSARDIAEILTGGGFTVTRNQIALHAPIKTIGMHTVPVALHPEVEVTITINVARNADEAERQARGENVTQRREVADEAEEAAAEAAAFFETEPAGDQGTGDDEKAD